MPDSNQKLLLIGSNSHSITTYQEGIRERFGGGIMYGGRLRLNWESIPPLLPSAPRT